MPFCLRLGGYITLKALLRLARASYAYYCPATSTELKVPFVADITLVAEGR